MAANAKMLECKKAITLVELMVVMSIIAILASLIIATLGKSRDMAKAASCLSNQRQLAMELDFYQNQYGFLPADGQETSLKSALSASIAKQELFLCPSAQNPSTIDSYSPFYCAANEIGDSQAYMLGCARHEMKCPVLYSDAHAELATQAAVTHDGAEIARSASYAERCFSSGTITYADGSTVEISKAKSNFSAQAIISYYRTGGSLNCLVRATGDGTIKASAKAAVILKAYAQAAIVSNLPAGAAFEVAVEEDDDEASAEVELTSGQAEFFQRNPGRGHANGKSLAVGQKVKVKKAKKK